LNMSIKEFKNNLNRLNLSDYVVKVMTKMQDFSPKNRGLTRSLDPLYSVDKDHLIGDI